MIKTSSPSRERIYRILWKKENLRLGERCKLGIIKIYGYSKNLNKFIKIIKVERKKILM